MENRKLNNIVVVGGGTAGWLAALCVRAFVPKAKVTLIESDSIGVLGAGEGTTPSFVTLLDFLGIPVSTLVKETNTTMKSGIRFTNWNNDGKYFDHTFFYNPTSDFYPLACNPALSYKVVNDIPNDGHLFDLLSKENKVAFSFREAPAGPNPIQAFEAMANFSIHFDAIQLSKLFRGIGTERGIERVEGKVIDINTNEYEEISSLVLEDGKEIECDFVFDCTGFAKLIIGNFYNAEWTSYKDQLTVDSALPFFLKREEELPAFTEATAMKYGWMWRIPLQHRLGCGYVFDSQYITDEEAKQEIEEYLGYVPEYPRGDKGSFKFKAGVYKTPWIKNCIAVGLSAGFIEPLEATSIQVLAYQLIQALTEPLNLAKRDETYAKVYNERVSDYNEELMSFIYWHYMTKRDDTEFWRSFHDINKAPELCQYYLKSWEYEIPNFYQFYQRINFSEDSWLTVGAGLGLMNKDHLEKYFEENEQVRERCKEVVDNQLMKEKFTAMRCATHSEFLDYLKNN